MNMAANTVYLQECLERISKAEERLLLADIQKAHANYIGERWAYSQDRMDELAQVITDGLARAGAKMADEVREIAGDTAPKYANFANMSLNALGEQMMGVYRHRIMVGRDTLVYPPEVEQAYCSYRPRHQHQHKRPCRCCRWKRSPTRRGH
jgi:hypothetical protein